MGLIRMFLYLIFQMRVWVPQIPCKSAICKGFIVPRPAFEILNMGTFKLILLNLTIKYKSLVINEIKKSYIYSD